MSAFVGPWGPVDVGADVEEEGTGENDDVLALELAYVPGRLKEGNGDWEAVVGVDRLLAD
jgi:hypothetical protein